MSIVSNLWRRMRASTVSFSNAWFDATIARVPGLTKLSEPERRRLRQLAREFAAEKRFSGVHGFAVTTAVRTRIATLAAWPMLNLGYQAFEGWRDLVIYPGAFRATRRERDPLTGVMHEYEVNLEGESWQHGPLILSWQDLEHDLRHPSGQQNVLIHELAHKLDALDGVMDGRPPLHPQMSGDAWAKVFSAAYADLSQRHQAGERCPIDPYGAQEPEEFFAVCCETYFTAPDVLRQAYPEVAAQMDQFFRGGGPSGHASGPASGQRAGRSSSSDAGSNSDW